MREKGSNSSMRRGLEIIRESFAVGRVLSPSLGTSRKQSMSDSQEEEDVVQERELFDICVPGQDDDNGDEEEEEQEGNLIMELVEKEDAAKPLPASSSSSTLFLPRYRENNGVYAKSRVGHCPSSVMDMGPGLSRVYSTPINWTPYSSSMTASDRREFSSPPGVDLSRKEILDQEGVRFQRRLQKQRSISSSIDSREEAIEEAWEKRRDRRLVMEEMNFSRDANNNNRVARSVGRSASDCGDRSWPTLQRTRSRTRSLTDEDMDELRGCIDLGFGFSNDEEDLELCNTLPALELCYAITRQYNDVTGRSSSPISTSGSSSSLDRCSSGSSLQSLPLESWRISSPGDHPSQVKTRLRHWAQAVACTVRQSF